MNEFMVAWEGGSLPLKTKEAAKILQESFLSEGRQATVLGRNSPASEWTEIA